MTIEASKGRRLVHTEVSDDMESQKFGWNGGIIALSTMANTFEKTNASGTENYTCEKSAVPYYIDPLMQKSVGNSNNVYRWVMGANFPVDKTTTRR